MNLIFNNFIPLTYIWGMSIFANCVWICSNVMKCYIICLCCIKVCLRLCTGLYSAVIIFGTGTSRGKRVFRVEGQDRTGDDH